MLSSFGASVVTSASARDKGIIGLLIYFWRGHGRPQSRPQRARYLYSKSTRRRLTTSRGGKASQSRFALCRVATPVSTRSQPTTSCARAQAFNPPSDSARAPPCRKPRYAPRSFFKKSEAGERNHRSHPSFSSLSLCLPPAHPPGHAGGNGAPPPRALPRLRAHPHRRATIPRPPGRNPRRARPARPGRRPEPARGVPRCAHRRRPRSMRIVQALRVRGPRFARAAAPTPVAIRLRVVNDHTASRSTSRSCASPRTAHIAGHKPPPPAPRPSRRACRPFTPRRRRRRRLTRWSRWLSARETTVPRATTATTTRRRGRRRRECQRARGRTKPGVRAAVLLHARRLEHE